MIGKVKGNPVETGGFTPPEGTVINCHSFVKVLKTGMIKLS